MLNPYEIESLRGLLRSPTYSDLPLALQILDGFIHNDLPSVLIPDLLVTDVTQKMD